MARPPHDRLRDALNGLGGLFEVVQESTSGNQVKILGRVPKQFNRAWIPVVDFLLAEEENLRDELDEGERPPWALHICKLYMRRAGTTIFAWNITMQARDDVNTATSDLCRLLSIVSRHVEVFKRAAAPAVVSVPQSAPMNVQPTRVMNHKAVPGSGLGGIMVDGEVTEMPLVGVTEQRNAPQAALLTPGVRGMGRLSGVSSKGAHHYGQNR